MDYERCIICQKDTTEDLRCAANSDNKSAVVEIYKSFIENWEQFRNAGVSVHVSLPLSDSTADSLMAKKATWHKNCRREIRPDRLERQLKKRKAESLSPCSSGSVNKGSESLASESTRRTRTKVSSPSDECLFCMKPGEKQNVLHSFQKLDLTEELKEKAIFLKDDNVLLQLSSGDVVANELKYHTYCYVSFNRRYQLSLVAKDDTETNTNEQCKILEEIICIVEEDISAGRRYFPLKVLYEEMCTRAKQSGTPAINRTRLKSAILERFPLILKEEVGFRNEVVLVSHALMKDIVTTYLMPTSSSEGYRILSKAASICRRELLKTKYEFQKDGFSADCQKNSVPDVLKFLIGMILYGASYDGNFENKQSTLSISQLISHNSQLSKPHETPLPIYLGLLIHSKFKNAYLINELHRLGISVSYNRVKYIERKMGESVLQQFNNEEMVCPTEMRYGLFTVAAVDNIDHNPSSTTSKDSFHGTAISVFQARNDEHDGIKRNFPLVTGAPKNIRLPDQFTTLPRLAGDLKSGPNMLPRDTTDTNTDVLLQELQKQDEWAKHVTLHLDHNTEDTRLQAKITWSAYHGQLLTKVEPNICGLFPLFKESSNDPRMILHSMFLVTKAVQHLNPNQIPIITGDQPIYALMKKLQWSHASVKDIVVMLGGFHTEKHTAKAIGDILQGSGWTDALIEAGISSQGIADGILKSAHVTKTRYAHQITYVALHTLLHEAHNELSPDTEFITWLENSKKCPTFAYWLLVMHLEALLMLFVRAHREGNFELYVITLQHICGLFFACDHYHYARWASVHVNDMKQLPKSVLDEFKVGRFTVNRSKKHFSSIAIDQGHEQLNKILKGSGGVIGLTQNETSLLNWSIFAPEVNKRLEDFRISSGYEYHEYDDCDYFHHDEGIKRQEDFLYHVKSMVDVLRKNGNPFHELSNDLVNLQGNVSDDNHSVLTLLEKGKEQYDRFVSDVLFERRVPFDTPIRRNNHLLFKVSKRKSIQSKHVENLRANISVLGQMYIATQSRKGNIEDFFAHECQDYPPSIANSVENMYHAKKSDVLVCLQNEVTSDENFDIISAEPSCYHTVIWDGGAMIHSLLPTAGSLTFQDYFQMCFLKHITTQLRMTQALHIVWDSYFAFSIKHETRDERGHGTRLKLGPNVKLPKDWSNYLRHSQNKQELFKYLSEESTASLAAIKSDFYITTNDTVCHVGPGKQMSESCDHEEADTRIVLHVIHAIKEGARTILVRTVDSDVVVILVHHFRTFTDIAENCEVFISLGTGKNKRLIDVQKITAALGPLKSQALPLWHALTGCDSTSSMRGRSKRIAFTAWKNSPQSVTDTMVHIMGNPFIDIDCHMQEFKSIEQFFINIYGINEADNINGARKIIFCYKNQNPDKLPPTQNTLLHHCKRSIYQASLWACAHKTAIKPPDPCQHGWKKEADRLLPVWTNIPKVSAACQEMVKCGCKKRCSHSCSCTKRSLNCTSLCKCSCENK